MPEHQKLIEARRSAKLEEENTAKRKAAEEERQKEYDEKYVRHDNFYQIESAAENARDVLEVKAPVYSTPDLGEAWEYGRHYGKAVWFEDAVKTRDGVLYVFRASEGDEIEHCKCGAQASSVVFDLDGPHPKCAGCGALFDACTCPPPPEPEPAPESKTVEPVIPPVGPTVVVYESGQFIEIPISAAHVYAGFGKK
jgi:hypothetical protein